MYFLHSWVQWYLRPFGLAFRDIREFFFGWKFQIRAQCQNPLDRHIVCMHNSLTSSDMKNRFVFYRFGIVGSFFAFSSFFSIFRILIMYVEELWMFCSIWTDGELNWSSLMRNNKCRYIHTINWFRVYFAKMGKLRIIYIYQLYEWMQTRQVNRFYLVADFYTKPVSSIVRPFFYFALMLAETKSRYFLQIWCDLDIPRESYRSLGPLR